MTDRVKNAIDVLLDAINNRTLAKGDCTACAVGNLVANGMGYSKEQYNLNVLEKLDYNYGYKNWSCLFCTDFNVQTIVSKRNRNYILKKYPEIKEQINSTGFTLDELAQIEKAFETNTKIHFRDYEKCTDSEILKDQIKGLEAVVEVMLSFDNSKADVKEVFTSKVNVCV